MVLTAGSMDHVSKRRLLLAASAATLALVGCGGEGSSPPPVSVAPTPSPSPTPTPSPSPTPTPTPTPTSSGTGQKITADIEYGQGATANGDIALLLDVYEPDTACTANRPTVLFVHGGGFLVGNKDSEAIRTYAQEINARGFNFVSINYRLNPDEPVLSDEGRAVLDDLIADGFASVDETRLDAFAAAFEDTVLALNFLEDNQDTYCSDTSKLVYWGSSAGAVTVLQVAYGLNQFDFERPAPLAVIDFFGLLPRPTDLEVSEAPFFIIHGTQDGTVAFQNSVDLADQADIVGVNYAFYPVIGAGHGVNAVGLDENTVDGVTLADLTYDFVEAHLTGSAPLYQTVEVNP